MPETIVERLEMWITVLEIAGATALIVGFAIATVLWLLESAQMERIHAVERYRQALGRSVLIGLEVLVAATIIKTVAFDLNLEGLGELALMVAIRGFLGWTTALEMTGRWPWQSSPATEPKGVEQ